MALTLSKIRYDDLNARQKENFNFLKVSAVLANYGYMTMRLSDDWGGADFIAVHKNGSSVKVQLKGRLTIEKQYLEKNIYIAFRDGNPASGDWYHYPHDEVCELLLTASKVMHSVSWNNGGGYSFPHLSKLIRTFLAKYKIGSSGEHAED